MVGQRVPQIDRRPICSTESAVSGPTIILSWRWLLLPTNETQPIELRFQANKEVAQYVEPKRKAVEVSGEVQKTYILQTNVSIEEIIK